VCCLPSMHELQGYEGEGGCASRRGAADVAFCKGAVERLCSL
jgi:hypothetical protein